MTERRIILCVIQFIVNIVLLFQIDTTLIIEYMFFIVLSASFSLLSYYTTRFEMMVISTAIGAVIYAATYYNLTSYYLGFQIIINILPIDLQNVKPCNNPKVINETDKQNENVIELLSKGYTNKEICEITGMKPYQVTRINQRHRKEVDNEVK